VDPMVAYWSQSTQFITVASKVEETGLTPIEDDDDVFCYDISLLRHSYDVLIVVTTSTADGDPTDAFGPLYLALLKAAASDDLPLSGVQHAVLGLGTSTASYNVPRLVDKYLGECGSRRCVMRSEVGHTPTTAAAAALAVASVRDRAVRDAFIEAVFEALQALPSRAAPPVSDWTAARRSDSEPTGRVNVKPAEQLAAHAPREPSIAFSSRELLVLATLFVALVLLCAWHRSTLKESFQQGSVWAGYYIAASVTLGGLREVFMLASNRR
jgi:hypothetical protein